MVDGLRPTIDISVLFAAGKHIATTRHHLSALVTPAGKSYECQAQQTITLISSDHQKPVVLLLSEVRLQPFDITSDFVFSEGKAVTGPRKCLLHNLERCCRDLLQGGHQMHCKIGMAKYSSDCWFFRVLTKCKLQSVLVKCIFSFRWRLYLEDS